MEKRIVFPGSYYDTVRFEKWLSQCAAQGLCFNRFFNPGKIPVFERTSPRRVRYYVEPDLGQYTSEEMEMAYSELGWEFAAELRGTCLIYQTEELWATKPTLRFEETAWSRKWRNLLLGQLLMLILSILSVYFILRPFFPVEYWEGTSPVLIFALLLCSAVLVLQNLWPLGANIYDLYTWNRCVRMGEETEEWRGIVILRWGEVVLWGALFAVFLPLIILTSIAN